MSNTVSASRPRETQRAFEHALAKYKEQLTSEEYAHFSEISNLRYLVTEAQAICKGLRPQITSSLESRASNLASSLEPFERILQGVCKLPPIGGDLIWGSVSYILEMAKSNTDVLEEVLGFFMAMADEVRYLQVVEDTFDGSHMVVSAVTEVYVAIIQFWLKAVRYYANKSKDDFMSRTRNWFASSNKMGKEFAKLKAQISMQKTRLHEVEATQSHTIDKADRARRRQNEISSWINAPHYKLDLTTAEELRHDGTCEWLRGRQEYRNWIAGQPGTLLVIYGTAGVGKTVLSSWIINEAKHHPAHHIFLYHFFKETDDSKNTALSAMRSLLHQLYRILLSTDHHLLTILETKVQAITLENHLDFNILWEIFSSLLSQYPQSSMYTATIILDAMDECKDSTPLVRSLRKLVHETSNKTRVVVTARPSGDHVDEFRRVYPGQSPIISFIINQDNVKDDIAAFVAHHISEIERLVDPRHHDLRDHVIASLGNVDNHQGMFLWAFLMCKEVECQLQVSGIRKLLDYLPKGLDGMYARICRRLSYKDETSREFGRLVLQWIVASRRPMTFAELEEALRAETVDSASSRKDFFGKDGGLLWSRRDIVRCCGDLVQYTGLAEGDTIGIIHLSARQFLSTPPSQLFRQIPSDMSRIVEPFLVDIPSAELKMGMTCITYILSTSSYSDEYLSPPITQGQRRTPSQDRFKERYPLFDYAVLYWTEYTLNVIQFESCLNIDGVQQLFATITMFTRSPVSIIWLEELILLTYIEFAQHTIRLFTLLGHPLIPTDVTHWSSLTLEVLLGYSVSLSEHPHMVRLCFSKLPSELLNSLERTTMGLPPLEAEDRRSWIHYIPITDDIISATAKPVLKCQRMKTGIRSRPLLSAPKQYQKFEFHSAAVTPSAEFIAATYEQIIRITHTGENPADDKSDKARFYSVYFTACWNIDIRNRTSRVDNWATLVFTNYTTDPRNLFSHTCNLVAFGKDNTIITPGGVCNLQTQTCVSRPDNIYNPDPLLHITETCFSCQSERVARIRDDTLEVLSIHGMLIYSWELGGMSEAVLRGFTNTGNKVIVSVGKLITRGLYCYLVNEAQRITMSLPSDLWQWDDHIARRSSAFTRDEDKFVTVLTLSSFTWRLAVWTFPQDEGGSYRDHANVIFIFGGPPFVFELVPKTPESLAEDVLIVEEDGSIIRRTLNLEWSPPEQEASQTRWVLTRKSSVLDLVIWSINRSGVMTVETWLLGSPHQKEFGRIDQLVPSMRLFEPSPDGRYLATDTAIFEARTTPNGYNIRRRRLPTMMVSAAFNSDGAFLACLSDDVPQMTLYIFDVSGVKITQIASHTFDEKISSHWLFPSNHDSNLLAVGNYLMRLEGHSLKIQAQTDQNIYGFSDCGLYYYDWTGKHCRLPGNLTEVLYSMTMRHPTSLKLYETYFYSPDILQLQMAQGVVYLKHKLVHEDDDAYRSRTIWVLPDTSINIEKTMEFALVWPEQDGDNLKLMRAVKGAPIWIDIGIKKGEMMKADAWD